jgi:hypothetical protein
LKLAETKSWNIGDHCSWLSVKSDGTRILSDGQIVGSQSPSAWGERIDISGGYDFASIGGPLLNDQGEVIGFSVALCLNRCCTGIPTKHRAMSQSLLLARRVELPSTRLYCPKTSPGLQ